MTSAARCLQAAAASAAEQQHALDSNLAQLKASLSAKIQGLESDLEARDVHTEAVSQQALELKSEVVSAQRAAEDARTDAAAADERAKVSGELGAIIGMTLLFCRATHRLSVIRAGVPASKINAMPRSELQQPYGRALRWPLCLEHAKTEVSLRAGRQALRGTQRWGAHRRR